MLTGHCVTHQEWKLLIGYCATQTDECNTFYRKETHTDATKPFLNAAICCNSFCGTSQLMTQCF